MRLYAYLTLMRPANIVTAVADILAGAAIGGIVLFSLSNVQITHALLLIISTIGLYGGGVVLNDYFDADLDQIERPERPIPSGKISKLHAFIFGFSLLTIGVISASFVSIMSGQIALYVVFFVLIYDKYAKHNVLMGPLFMGLCRGGNLLLGISINSNALQSYWFMAIIPVVFIAAITLTSQGEVKGSNRVNLILALTMDFIVAGFLIGLGIYNVISLMYLLPFLLLWTFINAKAKLQAIVDNRPENIKKAVKSGVISLIPLDASYAAGFGGLYFGMVVLVLLPLSLFLSKRFAVT